MSRAADLYWLAASKASAPFRRLYFDTEPLTHSNWPFVSWQFRFLLQLASTMGTELCVPEAALHERAEQWIRQMLEALSEASAKNKAAQKPLKSLSLTTSLELPTEKEIRTRYAEAEREAVEMFGLRRIPYSTRPLQDVFHMAVAREFTFEDKAHGVVGLQDCTVLLSGLDHLKSSPTSAGFVSNDNIFSRIPALVTPGIELRPIRGLKDLNRILQESLDASWNAEFSRTWHEMVERITEALTASRHEVERMVERTMDAPEIEKLFPGTVISVSALTVGNFGAIRPELKGESGDPIKFSCDVNVSYVATIEQRSEPLSVFFTGRETIGSSYYPPTQVDRGSTVVIELSAQVDPDYSNLRLQAARPRS